MSKPYEKYKDRIMKHCMFGLISSIVILFSVFVVFFIPFLKVDILPGVSVNASFYDVSESIAIVMVAVVVVFSIVDMIRNAVHIMKADNYSMRTYDILKIRSSRYVKRVLVQLASVSLFIVTTIEVVMIAIESLSHSSSDTDVSLISCVSGVNAMLIFPIIVVVAGIVLSTLRDNLETKIRSAIIKEEYDLTENNDLLANNNSTESNNTVENNNSLENNNFLVNNNFPVNSNSAEINTSPKNNDSSENK